MDFCALNKRTQIHTDERFTASASLGGTTPQQVQIWLRISLGSHSYLHVFHGRIPIDVRYAIQILDPYIYPYAGNIGNDCILMYDIARSD